MIGQKVRIDYIIRPVDDEGARTGDAWAHFVEPVNVNAGEAMVIDWKHMVAEVVRA